MDIPNRQLTRITDLTTQLGLTSRSLRYYEQIGLIQSIRPTFEKYRFYTAENIERLKQIIVLRKMQIPVKDILRIYENESMSVVLEALGGGFNVTLSVLQDKSRRGKIIAKIRAFAELTDEIVRTLAFVKK